ncbi:MAG: NHL repeat-containing protein, partial [Caldimonas sp.]
YQWASSSDGTNFTAIAGAVDSSYGTGAAALGQDGTLYRVVVSNALGSVTSASARLSVTSSTVAPAITVQPADQSVVAPATATFVVTATGTSLAYEWQVSVDGGVTFNLLAGGPDAPGVALSNTSVNQSGQRFRVRVSNGAGSVVSSAALLTVAAQPVAPSVTLQPADATVVVPATATFTAAASGVPTPSVQWQQSIDAGATWADLPAATNPSYTTPATVVGDSGKRFRAVFTNGSGSVNSNAAILTAAAAPVVALDTPNDVTFDGAGNAYIADTSHHTIRKVTPAGVVTTLAGLSGSAGSADGTGSAARFDTPRGLVVDAAANVYVADTFNGTIRKITPAGVVTTLAGLAGFSGSADGTGSAARFSAPRGLALDAAGNLYVADVTTIRKVTPGGVVTTLAGLAGNPGSADGTGAAARFNVAFDVALDSAGNVYVADAGSNATIRKITPAGVVTTLAGLAGSFGSVDGAGSAARFRDPRGIAVDAADNIFVSDRVDHTIRRITPAGDVTTVAGLSLASGNTDGTGAAARFNRPLGIAIDAAGNVHVADSDNQAIRKVTPAGVVTTVAQ